MDHAELVKQWPKVDKDYLKKLISLQNGIVVGRHKENEFDDFILNDKEKFNNPDYLQVVAERVELSNDFFNEHLDLCQFIYQFMKTNSDWEKLGFGLRADMRLGMFQDLFEEYLAS
jgi:hypothetical protein